MNRFRASHVAVFIATLLMLAGPLGLGGALHGLLHHHDPHVSDLELSCGHDCADPEHHHEPAHATPECPFCSASPAPVLFTTLATPAAEASDLGERPGPAPRLHHTDPGSAWLIRAPPQLSLA